MPNDTLHFGHDGPHIFRPFRNGHIYQFFYGPHIGIVIGHGTDIVQSVGMRDHLHIRQAFSQFLHSPVQISKIGRGLADPLTIQLQHNPKHSMRTRMLGTHIEKHFRCAFSVTWMIIRHELMTLIIGHLGFRPFADRFIQPGKKIKPAPPSFSFGRKILS